MWTCEELGLIGAREYIQRHAAENENMQFVMESDLGTFLPVGLEFTGGELVNCILQRIMRLVLAQVSRKYSFFVNALLFGVKSTIHRLP